MSRSKHDNAADRRIERRLERISRKQNFHQLLLLVILQTNQTIRNIMATAKEAIEAYLVADTELKTRLNTGLENVAEDEKRILKALEDINNNGGNTWTPEDQVKLDGAIGTLRASVEKVEALASAIEDAPAPPPVV